MKKVLCLLFVFVLVLSTICLAHAEGESWYCTKCGEERTTDYCPSCGAHRPSSTWPEIDFYEAGTTLRSNSDESFRYQAYFGPGKNFPEAGAYKPYKVTSMKALFREGDYIFVDMDYRTVGKRCLYFKDSALTNNAVDTITMDTYPAKTTEKLQPLFGPGNEYDGVTRLNDKNVKFKVEISANTPINVFFETKGWAFAEFSCELGTIRAWIPTNKVESK